MKTVGTAAEILSSNEYKDFSSNIYHEFQMVVGHNRKSTRGATTDENAHPFIEGNTILVHNGTLTNHIELTDQKVEVDSHAILHSIVERGYETTLKEIQGAFTLVWYDASDKTLRIIRNDQRPMFIANTSGAWYFASEKEMLEWILGREGEKIKDMTNCKPGTLYSFKLEDKDNMWYEPLELWSPPKRTTYIKETSPLKETGNTTYSNTDFLIGTEILIDIASIQTVKPNANGQTRLAYGQWAYDENVQVRCWLSEDEYDIIASSEEQPKKIDDPTKFIVRAKINVVMQKKNRFVLVCKDAVPYTPLLDKTGEEIEPDLFMFTNAKCSWCSSDVEVHDLVGEGIFKYETVDDYEIICPTCAKKEEITK
jgi:hypothetical protein